MYKQLLTLLDKIWCSDTQLSASLYHQISSDDEGTIELAFLRAKTCFCTLLELFGLFFMTLNFFPNGSTTGLVLGVALKIGGGLAGSYFQNYSGVFLSLSLNDCLKYLKTSGREIYGYLTNLGCSESEINAISILPNEIYQTELNSYQRAKFINLGSPIACAVALFLNTEWITASTVMLLGFASFPIGELFFREFTFRSEAEMRLGRSANLLHYIKKIYNAHILLTLKVNLLSQLPYLLIVFRFISGGSGLIASFFGLSQGLIGLTGTLSFQRSRMNSLRTIETAKHLISSITHSDLIVTPKRLSEHSNKTPPQTTLPNSTISNGVIFKDFSPKIFTETKAFLPLNLELIPGGIAILRATSGQGKSTFLLAVMHLLEHTGEIYFVTQSKQINIHAFSKDELEKKIFFFREETVEKSSRLIDLFKFILATKLSSFINESKMIFGEEQVNLAYFASDNLIEQEINKLLSNKPTAFPAKMLQFLEEMRELRANILQDILFQSEGNLASKNITPFRTFETLSSGEKRRLVACLAYETAKMFKDIKLVILDEPLTHLDKHSVLNQLEMIQKIQNLPNPPAILIISHHYIDEIFASLKNVQEVHLK